MNAQRAAGVKHTMIDVESGPIAALRCGASGPQVLLLPGYTGSKEDFAPLLGPAAAAGFTVTAIDLPGQFESPGPADPAAYVPAALATVVREVAATLCARVQTPGARVHLVGHSFGGLVARSAVIADRTAFASLVLMCSGPGGIGGRRRQVIEYLEPLLAASGLPEVYAASLALYRAQAGYVEPPAPMAAFLEHRFLAGVPAALQGMGEALRDEPDRVAELAATGVPALVLYGADDDAWPQPMQDEMAQRLGAERIVISDAAHSPAVENPLPTAKALTAFWQSREA